MMATSGVASDATSGNGGYASKLEASKDRNDAA